MSLPDDKARKPYEFGVKVSLAITHKQGLVVGARSFPGNPFDGHTLAAQLEQTSTLLQDLDGAPKEAVVDLGYRGVDKEIAPVTLIHRGKARNLSKEQRGWLKRRQAIEPISATPSTITAWIAAGSRAARATRCTRCYARWASTSAG